MTQPYLNLTCPTVSGSHSSYPILIKTDDIPATLIDGSAGAFTDGGGKLKAYTSSAKTTQLPVDVISFVSGVSPHCQIYVKTTCETSAPIYLEDDSVQTVQPAASSTYGSEAVWSEAEVAVLMEDITPIDHTGTHALTLTGSLTSTTGPLGNANSFAGTDRLSNTDVALRDILTYYDTTVSVISKKAAYELDKSAISWEGTDDFVLYPFDTLSGNGQRCFWRDVNVSTLNVNTESLANTWLWSDFTTRASNSHELYTNGVSAAGPSTATASAGPFTTFFIGGFPSQNFDGDIAQVIVWKTARDANWIATKKANESTATWLTVGAWSAGGGGGFVPAWARQRANHIGLR